MERMKSYIVWKSEDKQRQEDYRCEWMRLLAKQSNSIPEVCSRRDALRCFKS